MVSDNENASGDAPTSTEKTQIDDPLGPHKESMGQRFKKYMKEEERLAGEGKTYGGLM